MYIKLKKRISSLCSKALSTSHNVWSHNTAPIKVHGTLYLHMPLVSYRSVQRFILVAFNTNLTGKKKMTACSITLSYYGGIFP